MAHFKITIPTIHEKVPVILCVQAKHVNIGKDCIFIEREGIDVFGISVAGHMSSIQVEELKDVKVGDSGSMDKNRIHGFQAEEINRVNAKYDKGVNSNV